jgi:hypothetical protein
MQSEAVLLLLAMKQSLICSSNSLILYSRISVLQLQTDLSPHPFHSKVFEVSRPTRRRGVGVGYEDTNFFLLIYFFLAIVWAC